MLFIDCLSTCLSKWQAFKLATLSGLAEPLGVILVGRPFGVCDFVFVLYYVA